MEIYKTSINIWANWVGVSAVSVHQEDRAAGPINEADLVTTRGPLHAPWVPVVGELAHLGAVSVHYIDLIVTVSVTHKGDLVAVRRPPRITVGVVVVCESVDAAPVSVHYIDLGVELSVAVSVTHKGDLVAVRRPLRAAVRDAPGSVGELALSAFKVDYEDPGCPSWPCLGSEDTRKYDVVAVR